MATLKQIREGIAAKLNTIPNIQASAYMLSNPTPPAAHVIPGEIDYDQTMQRGMDMWTLTVQVFVALVTDKGGQLRLDAMLAPTGTSSVKAAIEADKTLGGVVDTLRVSRMTGYQIFNLERGPVLGAEWTVLVYG